MASSKVLKCHLLSKLFGLPGMNIDRVSYGSYVSTEGCSKCARARPGDLAARGILKQFISGLTTLLIVSLAGPEKFTPTIKGISAKSSY